MLPPRAMLADRRRDPGCDRLEVLVEHDRVGAGAHRRAAALHRGVALLSRRDRRCCRPPTSRSRRSMIEVREAARRTASFTGRREERRGARRPTASDDRSYVAPGSSSASMSGRPIASPVIIIALTRSRSTSRQTLVRVELRRRARSCVPTKLPPMTPHCVAPCMSGAIGSMICAPARPPLGHVLGLSATRLPVTDVDAAAQASEARPRGATPRPWACRSCRRCRGCRGRRRSAAEVALRRAGRRAPPRSRTSRGRWCRRRCRPRSRARWRSSGSASRTAAMRGANSRW